MAFIVHMALDRRQILECGITEYTYVADSDFTAEIEDQAGYVDQEFLIGDEEPMGLGHVFQGGLEIGRDVRAEQARPYGNMGWRYICAIAIRSVNHDRVACFAIVIIDGNCIGSSTLLGVVGSR